ncbi:MAG: DUF1059 domain-containing protein [Cuniculiplasma sp.]|jgi:predicted small metal-binding protein|nr:MAG: hypothetical protein AMDU5_GPLC00014G0113 [Thermoplasmatales archaeon Gpl]MCI2412194.1 DUF1059 domain-containing protein [Cuniculiplasma sp.]
MSRFRFRCRTTGKECDYEVTAKTREEAEEHARAHAQRFHEMQDSTSLTDLVNRSLEEVEDYRD